MKDFLSQSRIANACYRSSELTAKHHFTSLTIKPILYNGLWYFRHLQYAIPITPHSIHIYIYPLVGDSHYYYHQYHVIVIFCQQYEKVRLQMEKKTKWNSKLKTKLLCLSWAPFAHFACVLTAPIRDRIASLCAGCALDVNAFGMQYWISNVNRRFVVTKRDGEGKATERKMENNEETSFARLNAAPLQRPLLLRQNAALVSIRALLCVRTLSQKI